VIRVLKEILIPSRRDRNYLDLAFKIALTSDCRQKHGAVLVKGGRVLGFGVNKQRNDPEFVISDTGPDVRGTVFSVHAEIDALSRVKNPRGAVLYVARCSRIGCPAFSRPCDACTRTLIRAGIKAVVYT
jgi:deoxycytidylate deaminase